MLTVSLLICAMMALATADDNSTRAHCWPWPGPGPENPWVVFNGRRFLYVPHEMTWSDAEKACQKFGANLASVHSADEDQFLRELILKNSVNNPETFIGGTSSQQINSWLWSDGSIFSFTSWCPGKPDDKCGKQGCLLMNHGAEKCWDDRECSSPHTFICVINL